LPPIQGAYFGAAADLITISDFIVFAFLQIIFRFRLVSLLRHANILYASMLLRIDDFRF